MIFVHTYQIGTNENKKERRAIWDSQEQALEQQRVLGGVIQAFEAVENIAANEYYKDVVVDEVATIIDEMSTDAPGSPRELEPGSAAWDGYKLKTLNNIRNLLDEIN